MNPISGHAWSTDGYNWTFSTIQPYSNAVHRTDGSVQNFATLERPKLLWGDALDPFREQFSRSQALPSEIDPKSGGIRALKKLWLSVATMLLRHNVSYL